MYRALAASMVLSVSWAAQPVLDTFLRTCMNVPAAICLDEASQVITPTAPSQRLVAYWSFDRLFAVDESGGRTHFHPGFRPGPPVWGSGASAYLHPEHASTAHPASSPLQSDTFTVAFWLYLLSESSGGEDQERGFFSRGGDAFQLFIQMRNRTLGVRTGHATLSTQASFLPRRWTQVAVVYSPNKVTVYLNGINDGTTSLGGGGQAPGKGDIVLGHPTGTQTSAGLEAYLDDLRIYTGALSDTEVEALLIPRLGPGLTTAVKLGKLHSSLEEAKNSISFCRGDYHLCYQLELEEFGYAIARQQGYLTTAAEGVWYGDSLPDAATSPPDLRRLALCCEGSAACAVPRQHPIPVTAVK